MHGARKEIPNGEKFNKYGGSAREVEIGTIGNVGASYDNTFRGDSGGIFGSRALFLYHGEHADYCMS